MSAESIWLAEPPDDDPQDTTSPPIEVDVEDEDDKPQRKSAATMLVSLALDRYRLGVSTDDEPFAVPTRGPRVVRLLRGGRGSLRAELASAYFADTGRAAPQQALADALLVLDGMARELPPEDLALRVAEYHGDLVLDLGDVTGRAVRVTSTGWQLVEDPPVLFRRSALTGALPVPVAGGSLGELWSLLNVAELDRVPLTAALVAALMPSIPHPIIALLGEQGTGKSSASRMLAGVLDPSPVPSRKQPRDVDAWITAAAGSWVVNLDNVSSIPAWWSDALCRAVSGDGDVRRRLYTDGELAVFAFIRCILLNGIDLGGLRGDLAERLLRVELDVIDPTSRRTDRDLAAAWDDAHPRILGALLDLACQVLRVLPTLKLSTLPRMADFARVLAAVDEVLGTDGMSRYTGQADSLSVDVVTSEPVLAAVVRQVTAAFHGTAAELLDLLTPDDHGARLPREWPSNPRALSGLLKRHSPALRRLGWQVSSHEDPHDKTLRWSLLPPVAGDRSGPIPARPAETRTSAGVAGVAGQDDPASQDDDDLDTRCPHGMVNGDRPDPFVGGRVSCPACATTGAAS